MLRIDEDCAMIVAVAELSPGNELVKEAAGEGARRE
jgi:hypothetical protein